VASGSQNTDLGAQISAFLSEFKSLLSQLIRQTITIITMLKAVLPRLTAQWLLHYILLSGFANALSSHLLELQTFPDMNDIDIALISETHFTSRTVSGFPLYRFPYHTS
jgi:hypothetical protein